MSRKVSSDSSAKKDYLEAQADSIKHELRKILVTIHEGTGKVLDGLGDTDCKKCYKILQPVLMNIKELDKMMDRLLNVSRFKSMLEKYKKDTPVTDDDLEIFKNELIGIISHIIRTPLTIIKEGLALALDEIPGKLNPKQKAILTTVKDNVDRLITQVEKVFKNKWDDTIKTIGKDIHYQSIIKD